MTPTVNAHPTGWCASCGKSWGLDTIAVTVAHITICDKCIIEAADVATAERVRREGEKPRERRE